MDIVFVVDDQYLPAGLDGSTAFILGAEQDFVVFVDHYASHVAKMVIARIDGLRDDEFSFRVSAPALPVMG
ncbi:hypothetical protein GCM10007933_40580 [Zoogloea oryzae]|uniref:Uncharacterized protein n=1 Tax=Zoogloea oryzae TaxID=310767 RepID=A0ABQ6FG11_9RHOO|nr:hypothetical protein GCM10007933_40580 [Zoogloea oryzae]